MITSEVYCSFQMEGIHHWPTCPFEEVAYLRLPHRHMFHFKALVNVSHDDRDVEFIILKHMIREYLNETYWHDEFKCLFFGPMSCEMIARELMEEFNLSQCEVGEDGENGAVLTVTGE